MSDIDSGLQRKLTAMIDLLPRCHSAAEFGDNILPRLCDLFDSRAAVIHYYAGDLNYGRYYDPVHVNVEQPFIEKFREQFSQLDPFPQAAMRRFLAGDGYAFSSDQLVDMNEFSTSEFYLDFLKPQQIYHMLIVVIARGNEPFAFLGFHRDRDQDSFSEEEVALANRLGPYLSSVADRVHMAGELVLYKRVVDTLSYGLMNKGVLILDQSLTLIYANEYACRVFEATEDFNIAHRRFPQPIAEACQSLLDQGEELKIMSSSNFSMQVENQKIDGYVRANQSDGQPLLFLAFFNSDEFGVLNPRVCEEFGLTTRELDIVRCVIEGKTNPEIADELFISVRTVQNHLRSIYSKCDVHNRTSLSNRVLSLT